MNPQTKITASNFYIQVYMLTFANVIPRSIWIKILWQLLRVYRTSGVSFIFELYCVSEITCFFFVLIWFFSNVFVFSLLFASAAFVSMNESGKRPKSLRGTAYRSDSVNKAVDKMRSARRGSGEIMTLLPLIMNEVPYF